MIEKYFSKFTHREVQMNKKILLIIQVIIILSASLVGADEIHLKDGRVIRTKTCWEENGKINYQKYNAVIGINRDLVENIIYEDEKIYSYSTVYFTDGTSNYCAKLWEENLQIYCENGKIPIMYDKEKVVKILKGRNQKFKDLPTEAQKKWTAATVYFKNKKTLLVNTVWQEGDKLYCKTNSGDFTFDIADVSDVKKGHRRKPKYYELPVNEQKKIKEKIYLKALEDQAKRKEIEHYFDNLIR